MNSCHQLSDRMPAVARGTARWSADDERHLANCPDCSGEWTLVRTAAGLGLEVERSLDLDALALGVRTGLEASPVHSSRIRRWSRLAPAAAVAAALLLLLWRGWSEPDVEPGSTVVAVSLLPELETLTNAELESMLQLLPRDGMTVPGLDSFEDLTEAEVSTVLEDLEG